MYKYMRSYFYFSCLNFLFVLDLGSWLINNMFSVCKYLLPQHLPLLCELFSLQFSNLLTNTFVYII